MSRKTLLTFFTDFLFIIPQSTEMVVFGVTSWLIVPAVTLSGVLVKVVRLVMSV